jgi:hypothetical protein
MTALTCLVVLVAQRVAAQSASATLSGTAIDESHAVVPQVQITVVNLDTRVERRSATNNQGIFSVPSLPPGRYTVTGEHAAFSKVVIPEILLNVDDQQSVTLLLKVGPLSDAVTVAVSHTVETRSPAVTTVVDREFLQELPLNGRTLHGLLELTPGVVLVSGQGQFSVNGQRDNANYFILDGVGANAGIAPLPSLGPTAGGTVPAFNALGSTASLVSVDAVQEFRVETSTYAAEFGRTPGAQVSLVTRSGTNQLRGDMFEYFRNEALDANDWFANSLGLPKPRLRQSDFGGATGGPIVRDRTFFFVSYEGLRLEQPRVGITPVPTLVARQRAPPGVQPYLLAFPVPNGQSLGNDLAEFAASYSNAATLNAAGIRVDHNIGRTVTVFGRYWEAPSETRTRGGEGAFNALSSIGASGVDTRTVTTGITQILGQTASHELRVNVSRSTGRSTYDLDDFGGAVPPADTQIFPAFASRANSLILFAMLAPSAGYTLGKNVDNRQRQLNIVDAVSLTRASHLLKAGVDYRRLSPVLDVLNYGEQALFFNGASGAISGHADSVSIFSTPLTRFPIFTNVSAYVQDAWRVSSRMTLTAGLRWELNPPPSEANGNLAYTVVGLESPAAMTLAPLGTPLWKTTYDNFAPRVGVAWQLSTVSGRESVLRAGAGTFYDLGTGSIGGAFQQSAFPYFSSKPLSNVAFPLNSIDAQPAPINATPPYQNLVVADSNLVLPRVYEWSAAIEQALGSHTVSLSYVGAAGRRLLRGETLAAPNPNFGNMLVVRNSSSSDYRALQLQYRHPLARGLQALASYTLAQSLDNVSNESFALIPAALIDPNGDRGPSDFDIRHSFSAAATYLLPTATAARPFSWLSQGWSMDAIVRARSAAPINVVAQGFLLGVRQVGRPNLVPGVPVYLDDPAAPGGIRINRAAFTTPVPGQQGTLSRNALRGFPVSQVDVSLRRRFALSQSKTLEVGADVFNIFNHPNFADPDRFLADSTFGQSQSMFNQSIGGLNSLYQLGGPRSVQLSIRVKL